jgi:hypothetical protein
VVEEREVEDNGGEEREGKEMDGCPLTIAHTMSVSLRVMKDTPHRL